MKSEELSLPVVRSIARLGHLPTNTIIEWYANTTRHRATMFCCRPKAPVLNRGNRMRAEKRIVSLLDLEIPRAARLIDHKADDREAGLP